MKTAGNVRFLGTIY